ncbi:MAG: hypothetical protein Greene041679_164 [Parcubacteria group bacterium Greene0416_79]|nr:MAG: hypothetical protein Greene041679_164 [Parcubacteria group bacterium Greene0416_79]
MGRGGKRGKTSGRGGKGQTARAGHKVYPQLRDVIRRIPKLRGRGKHSLKAFREKATPVSLRAVSRHFDEGSTITPDALLSRGVVSLRSGRVPRIKILGGGARAKKFIILGLPASKSAREAIEKAGGSITNAPPTAKID